MGKKLTIVILSVAVAVLLILFLPFGGAEISAMPEYPEVVTTPGIYQLDEKRFVEVRESDGRIEFHEGEILSRSADQHGPEEVTASTRQVAGISLEEGWSVGFAPPTTLIIDPGSGHLTRRQFGERSSSEIELSTVTRVPSEPTPGSLAEVMKRNSHGSTDERTAPNETRTEQGASD